MTIGMIVWSIFWLTTIALLICWHIRFYREDKARRTRGSLSPVPTESEEIVHAEIYPREGDEPK